MRSLTNITWQQNIDWFTINPVYNTIYYVNRTKTNTYFLDNTTNESVDKVQLYKWFC